MPRTNDFTQNLSEPPSSQTYDDNAVYGLPIANPKKALALLSTKEIRVGALIWKPTGLVVDGTVTREDWEETGRLLNQLDSSLQWLIGDLIVCGEDLKYGDQKQIAQDFGFEYATIRDYAYVARNVQMSVRTDTLEFGHHKLVAALPAEEQAHWLTLAAEGTNGKRWSIAQLRQAINSPSLRSGEGLGEGNNPIIRQWHQTQASQRQAIQAKYSKANPTERQSIIDYAKDQSRYWSQFAQSLTKEEEN